MLYDCLAGNHQMIRDEHVVIMQCVMSLPVLLQAVIIFNVMQASVGQTADTLRGVMLMRLLFVCKVSLPTTLQLI